MPSLEQAFGGARHTTSAVDFALNWSGARVHTIDATASGVDVTLPPATSLQVGGGVFYLVNDGDESFTVKASGGATIATCPVGEALRLDLLDNSSAGGVWASEQSDTDGEPVDPDPPPSTVLATVTAYETRTGYNLIRGTVPVPEDRTPASLFLRDEDGTAWPTEIRTVMRGPGGVPRILELRAYVDVPSPGGERHFDVEEGLIPSTESFHDHVTMTLFSEAPNTQADQSIVTFSSRLLQGGVGSNTGAEGDVTRTIINSGELQASGGSRLWGYRAHITTVAGMPDVWLIEMTVQNANVGNPGSPLGANILHDVFFNEIRILVSPTVASGLTDADFSVLYLHPTPFTDGKKIMKPDSGGKMHPLMQGGAKAYRFVVYRSSSPSQIAAASPLLGLSGFFVCDHSYTLWSWSNPATSWYGPQNLPVPQLDLTGFNTYGNSASYTTIKNNLLSGDVIGFEVEDSIPIGPYHIKGPTDGGISSGIEITQFKGYDVINTGSGDMMKTYLAVLSMNIDRSASNASPNYTGVYVCDANQAPVRVSDWNLSNFWAKAYPGQMNTSHQGPWPRLNANQWRFSNASDAGLISYYTTLDNFELYKDSHMIRPLGPVVPAICLLNDPIAKDYLAHHAVWARAGALEYGGGPAGAHSHLWGSYESSSSNVQDFPDKGGRSGFGGRNGGWLIWTTEFDWLVTDDDTKRVATGPWFAVVKDHDQRAQFKVGGKNWTSYDSNGDATVILLKAKWTANGGAGTLDVSGASVMESSLRAGPCLSGYACTGDPDWLEMLANACDGIYNYYRIPSTGTYYYAVPTRQQDATDPACEVWTDPYVGPGPSSPGEAPNCFENNNADNYFVGLYIAGALKHDPNHASAWGMIYAFTGESTPEDARDALLAQFEADPGDKFEHSWGPVLAMVQQITEA